MKLNHLLIIPLLAILVGCDEINEFRNNQMKEEALACEAVLEGTFGVVYPDELKNSREYIDRYSSCMHALDKIEDFDGTIVIRENQ